jgi:hypothetical protein
MKSREKKETTICFFLNSMPPPSSAFKTIIYQAPYTIVDIHLVYMFYFYQHEEELMMIRFSSCFFLSCCLDFDLKKKLLIIYLLFILFCGNLSYHSNEYGYTSGCINSKEKKIKTAFDKLFFSFVQIIILLYIIYC